MCLCTKQFEVGDMGSRYYNKGKKTKQECDMAVHFIENIQHSITVCFSLLSKYIIDI